MATASPPAARYDLEGATSYLPIPAGPNQPRPRPSTKLLSAILFSSFLLISLLLLFTNHTAPSQVKLNDAAAAPHTPSRGVSQGVSEKVFRQVSANGLTFPWNSVMLSWQRTAFHFQPEQNWMNGPLFHMGWYHLFYQYNQDSAVWGNITWGHAVSKDLIHWFHLPYAMVPDQWYDVNGVWTGSATILPDGQIIMLYTGDTNDAVQVQCLAYPANLSDPLLLHWVKSPSNPVLFPPPGIGSTDFRDPTTAWLSPGGDKWRITIGSKVNKTGISIVYETSDFIKYDLLDGFLHQVAGTGMWECIDFYPVSLTEGNGLDTSINGPGVKHVMKASLDDDKNDYYALGTYDPIGNKWTPDNPELDVGIGLRYDYGKYYASKTFYDQNKRRRILWGWISETDAESLDLLKGWACVQSIPRTVVFDKKTGTDILQWPVEEVESLRGKSVELDVKLGPGSIVPVEVDSASQLDVEVSFEVDEEAVEAVGEAGAGYDCTTSGGASNRGVLGPFGIVVLADDKLTELTPIYFYVAKGPNGKTESHFCADELRSSQAPDVVKVVYGSSVPVVDGEKFTIRSLVDHSIVESFGQGGRRVITSRVYPTKAIDGAARVFLFNNATGASVTASLKIWKMGSADIRRFPSDQL
ncbi:beta-fructofuranosidase, soluble isoenzyme I-like isoform X2 [Salvia miltiorrhiza]|uniref:beta-fructofuranosidase, soluble isoenzyme I-like isoform X2 n=1 Tax=Salvia miltiorrhiza TaxID=226208 RepID=UPI0025ACECDB|nr:beta-fructofuranosidase, soluble isoenzyme I-like isoform X2 [Salvia miltiorrhiza]